MTINELALRLNAGLGNGEQRKEVYSVIHRLSSAAGNNAQRQKLQRSCRLRWQAGWSGAEQV